VMCAIELCTNAPFPNQPLKTRSQLIQPIKVKTTEHHNYSSDFVTQFVLNVKNGFSHKHNT